MNSTIDINSRILEGYISLLSNLTPSNKLELISLLTASIKTDLAEKKNDFKESFGAFVSHQSAEELIEEIRASRIFTREIEPF